MKYQTLKPITFDKVIQMGRIISPSRDELENLRTKLTPGEQCVFELFDRSLPLEWEIYVQPHLNGLRPDFVLLNPKVGIAVFEVKDWDLSLMHYYVTKNKKLYAEKDGKYFSLQSQNPIVKIHLYKEEIFNLYCPRIDAKVKVDHRKSWAAITAGVIFPFSDTSRVRELFNPIWAGNNFFINKYQPLSGRDEIIDKNIGSIFPEYRRKTSYFMNEDVANDLRGWLIEPFFSREQRETIPLDNKQRILVESRTKTGYRRIKGPAGSGKSLVLAVRAARLANEKKRILFVTYNITLINYLRDLFIRNSKQINNIEFVNFHMWCKRVCINSGLDNEYNEIVKKFYRGDNLDKDNVLRIEIPKLAEKAVNSKNFDKYDAIFVDEGQDFDPYWWNIIRKSCKNEGEKILAADITQDIYDCAKNWTDKAMTDAGFSGEWAQLNISYRLPDKMVELARIFARIFLPNNKIDFPEPDIRPMLPGINIPCVIQWNQCSHDVEIEVCKNEIINMMYTTGIDNKVSNSDIVFITDNIIFGNNIINDLESIHIKAANTFDNNESNRRRQKMAFYKGDARIKATTIHSFKGWEACLLVIHISKASSIKDLSLIYTALTRLKRVNRQTSRLSVICSAPELAKYAKLCDNKGYLKLIHTENATIG